MEKHDAVVMARPSKEAEMTDDSDHDWTVYECCQAGLIVALCLGFLSLAYFMGAGV